MIPAIFQGLIERMVRMVWLSETLWENLSTELWDLDEFFGILDGLCSSSHVCIIRWTSIWGVSWWCWFFILIGVILVSDIFTTEDWHSYHVCVSAGNACCLSQQSSHLYQWQCTKQKQHEYWKHVHLHGMHSYPYPRVNSSIISSCPNYFNTIICRYI